MRSPTSCKSILISVCPACRCFVSSLAGNPLTNNRITVRKKNCRSSGNGWSVFSLAEVFCKFPGENRKKFFRFWTEKLLFHVAFFFKTGLPGSIYVCIGIVKYHIMHITHGLAQKVTGSFSSWNVSSRKTIM